MTVKLSVIIVNYNVRYFLEHCLRSVEKAAAHLPCEIIVVDNASVDGSCEMVKEHFPGISIIRNTENLGFAKANNVGIRQSKGKYVLLLNPDTVIEENIFKNTVAFMDEHPDAGGLGVQMVDGKGRFLPESKRSLPTPDVAFYKIFGLSAIFPGSKVFGKYHLGYLSKDETHAVQVLSGAFMLLRREALDKTGLLDEDFFMYGEDIDISYRLLQAGYKNYYYPKSRIIHYKGESTKKSSINYVRMFYSAMVTFANKHFTRKHARLLNYFIQTAIWLRASIALFSRVFQRLLMPMADFAGFVLGLFLLRQMYTKFTGIIYHDTLVDAAFTLYGITWVAGIWLGGGYRKPVKLTKCLLGLTIGTALILAAYALLSESYRFSRALTIFGVCWSFAYALSARFILHLTKFKQFRIGGVIKKRFAVVGEKSERIRVIGLLRKTHFNIEAIVQVATSEEDTGPGFVAQLHQLNDTVRIFNIDEVIFCSKNIDADEIINQMSFQPSLDVEYKIAPPESLFIIGSNSIKSGGELYYVMDVNSIAKPACKRMKRAFDLSTAFLLLLSLPVTVFIVNNKGKFIIDILQVLAGVKTWVGYAVEAGSEQLPEIKPAVMTLSDAFSTTGTQSDILEMNLLYARDYNVKRDFEIFIKKFRQL